MLIVADNDVRGAVAALRRVLESPQWSEYSAALDLQFAEFESIGLARDSSDRTVWLTCQKLGAVLITGNRSGGPNSLDRVIRESADHECLPVLTIADPQGPIRDAEYASAAAVSLLDLMERIESLRGVGRLFIP